MINFNKIIESGTNILFVTLDTLRWDAAIQEAQQGNLPNICREYIFEKRHTTGSFTYPAHQAFFAGFLPSKLEYEPIEKRELLFYSRNMDGKKVHEKNIYFFDEANIVESLAKEGYRTICIGGVIFFSKRNALCSVMPNMFQESYWQPKFGVTNQNSAENQIDFLMKKIEHTTPKNKLFLFINFSAIHGPNYYYLDEFKDKKFNANKNSLASEYDSVESQKAALRYVDKSIEPLMEFLKSKGDTLCIFTSDHGTCYGEDGMYGHILHHENVLNVPYLHYLMKGNEKE